MPENDVLLTKQSVVDAAQRAFRTGLQTNIGGNLSARIPSGDACVIKATGVGFAECTIENLCVVGLDGQVREGGQPTSDVAIHLAIYQMRPEVHGIAHAHPPWVTGWAAASIAPPSVTVTADAKLGSVPMVPLAPGGLTQTDAEIVAMMGAGGPRGAILEKHGAIACGRSILEAMHLLELIEENAHIAAVRSMVLGPGPRAGDR
jgi:L-ribulose-5-phosphate 4-epimerase